MGYQTTWRFVARDRFNEFISKGLVFENDKEHAREIVAKSVEDRMGIEVGWVELIQDEDGIDYLIAYEDEEV